MGGRGWHASSAALLVLGLVGCGASAENPSAAQQQGVAQPVSGQVTLFAAASLKESFSEIAERFEQANSGTTVLLNFGSSSALAQQIVSGAPADVFAAASPQTMRTIVEAGNADPPQVFARNSLQIAVPPDNPGRVTGLADFAKKELKLALCAPRVPCGAAAERAFAVAGITPAPDTLEQDVKAALSKVLLGEVDAALVYVTDVLAAGEKVRGIAFPEATKTRTDYQIASVDAATKEVGGNAAAASAFVSFVLSKDGQAVLAGAGFDRP